MLSQLLPLPMSSSFIESPTLLHPPKQSFLMRETTVRCSPKFRLFSLPFCHLMLQVYWQHLETPMAQPSSLVAWLLSRCWTPHAKLCCQMHPVRRSNDTLTNLLALVLGLLGGILDVLARLVGVVVSLPHVVITLF